MNAKPSDRLPFKSCTPYGAVLVVSLVTALAWARPPSAVRAFNEAVKFFNAKQFNEAIPKFDEAISSDSEFPEAFFARGACKYYLKSLDAALMDLNDAVRLKPDYMDARALRGAVYYEADRWDQAMEDFNYVLGKNPRDAQSLVGRAVISLKRQNLSGAARDFRAFLRVRPDDELAPRVRQILVQLKRAAGPEAGEEQASESSNAEPGATPRHSASARPVMTPEQIQKLADGLLGSSMNASYDRKVLRGENAQAVGDIHRMPGTPAERKTPDADVQIVEPQ